MAFILVKAVIEDSEMLHSGQVSAFKPLLERYRDFDTSPANEPISKVRSRIREGHFYKVMADGQFAGAIRIKRGEETESHWISPMFILPEWQGRGFAARTIQLAAEKYPEAGKWELATILEEEKNCRVYEKAGFTRTGVKKKLNDAATLVYFEKNGERA
ncbi:GNAT family N-acetyltransferase [Bacillus sp. FSL H8-0547]